MTKPLVVSVVDVEEAAVAVCIVQFGDDADSVLCVSSGGEVVADVLDEDAAAQLDPQHAAHRRIVHKRLSVVATRADVAEGRGCRGRRAIGGSK